MSYFKHFGQRWHSLPSGEQILINDITKFSIFQRNFKENPHLFILHTIRDNERPETLSKRMYGTRNYWWSILLFNDIFNVDEQWPLTETQLQTYIKSAYPQQSPIDVHHYVDASGLVVDIKTYQVLTGVIDPALIIARYDLRAVSIQEHEQRTNDNKRNIRLIDPDLVGQLDVDLAREFKNGR